MEKDSNCSEWNDLFHVNLSSLETVNKQLLDERTNYIEELKTTTRQDCLDFIAMVNDITKPFEKKNQELLDVSNMDQNKKKNFQKVFMNKIKLDPKVNISDFYFTLSESFVRNNKIDDKIKLAFFQTYVEELETKDNNRMTLLYEMRNTIRRKLEEVKRNHLDMELVQINMNEFIKMNKKYKEIEEDYENILTFIQELKDEQDFENDVDFKIVKQNIQKNIDLANLLILKQNKLLLTENASENESLKEQLLQTIQLLKKDQKKLQDEDDEDDTDIQNLLNEITKTLTEFTNIEKRRQQIQENKSRSIKMEEKTFPSAKEKGEQKTFTQKIRNWFSSNKSKTLKHSNPLNKTKKFYLFELIKKLFTFTFKNRKCKQLNQLFQKNEQERNMLIQKLNNSEDVQFHFSKARVDKIVSNFKKDNQIIKEMETQNCDKDEILTNKSKSKNASEEFTPTKKHFDIHYDKYLSKEFGEERTNQVNAFIEKQKREKTVKEKAAKLLKEKAPNLLNV